MNSTDHESPNCVTISIFLLLNPDDKHSHQRFISLLSAWYQDIYTVIIIQNLMQVFKQTGSLLICVTQNCISECYRKGLWHECSLKSLKEYGKWQIWKTFIWINSNLVRLMAVFTTKLKKTHNIHTDKLMTENRTMQKYKTKLKYY